MPTMTAMLRLLALALALLLPPSMAAAQDTKPCPDTMQSFDGTTEVVECACSALAVAGGSVWGSGPYTSDSRVCRAARHAGAVPMAGGVVRIEMGPGRPRYPRSTRNGVESIDYGPYAASFTVAALGAPPAAAATGPEACPTTMTSFAGSDEVLRCVCPAGQVAAGSVWGSDTYTADSAVCRAALHAGAITPRGGEVTVRMLEGQARYVGTTRRGVQSQNYGAYRASFRFDGVAAATGPEQCPDTMMAYAGSDETLRCACPAQAVAGSGSVWGTDAYSADSALCRAALHAGAVTRRGGEVTVRMLDGLPRYVGTTRNGVQTQNFGPYRASYRFEGLAATGPGLCPDNMSAYAGSDEVLACVCTGEAVLRAATVWGSTSYTADSATCTAARHAGVVPVTGGLVTLRMLPGEPRYPGSTRNGVQSQNWAAYPAGFRFEGAQNTAVAAPVQAPVADSLRRTGQVSLYITFRTGSADLDIGAAPVLMQVRDAMVADPALRLRLVGHTDNQGGPNVNLPLSQRRAASVRAWLTQNGVDGTRLVAEGRGQTAPIADNGSEAGRSLNRRVEAVRIE
jgi:outer membrane protein OmpA-like peptidoglycan-associated protein